MILYLNSREGVVASMRPLYGAKHELDPVEKCFGQNCITIGYSVVGDAGLSD